MNNKGRQSRSVVTVLGVVKVVRRWWHATGQGSVVPADEVIDPGLASVSLGVREMACRLNNNSTSFDTTAANLNRTAQIVMSGEQVRKVVQAEGKGGRKRGAEKGSGPNGTVVALTPVSLYRCPRGVGLAAPGGVLA